MSKAIDICIGITDAEMRVYAEYMEEIKSILDAKKNYEEKKLQNENRDISSKSFVKIGTKDALDFYRDEVLDKMARDEMYSQIIDGLQEMYDNRKQYCIRIEDRLEGLDEKTKQLLYFRYFDHMTLEEIAKKTASNRQSVFEKLNKILKFQLPS